jgi:16S rRNA (uracil1498-N3)-methyltransferase
VRIAFAAAAPAVAHVFVPDIAGDGDLTVTGDDGHHLQRVRRLQPGEAVTAGDGVGHWRLCRVRDAADGRVVLTAAGPVTLEPALVPRVTVAFAPAKSDHAGTVVHQLVELGVDRIAPVTFARSVVRWEGSRAGRALERLRRVAREAAMQARRARLPEVVAGERLEFLSRAPGLVVADPAGASAAALAPIGESEPDLAAEFVVVVGPEGGFDPSERLLLADAARLAVGPHVLRAVTAPVAVAAAIAGIRRPEPALSAES